MKKPYTYEPKGTDFARAVMCIAAANGKRAAAQLIAERTFGIESRVNAFLEKAAVPAAYTGDAGGWAEDIAESVGHEFIELVNQVSVFGQLNLRPAPLNTRLVGVGTGGIAYWRGEARPIPITSMAFNGGAFPPLVVSAIAALSKEVFKVGDPLAEQYVRAELIRAMVQAIDTALMDPSNSGTAGVKPASPLNAVTPIDGSGVTDVDFLLKAAINGFGGDLTTAHWVARPETFVSLHDGILRPNVGARGGELLGIPCIASRHVLQPVGGEILALVDGQGIAAGDTGVDVNVTDQATLEMLDASLQQDATGGTGAQQISLWQSDLIAIKVDRHVNWSDLRSSVSYISGLTLEDVSA